MLIINVGSSSEHHEHSHSHPHKHEAPSQGTISMCLIPLMGPSRLTSIIGALTRFLINIPSRSRKMTIQNRAVGIAF